MTAPTMSVLQQHVLRALTELHERGDYAFYTHTIANAAMVTPRHARIALRALQRKGLVHLVRGLVDECTGELRGSGYEPTDAGYHAVELLTQGRAA